MSDDDAREGPGRAPLAVHAAELRCEPCAAVTPHRILRLARGRGGGPVRGLARCRSCGFTHPFESEVPRTELTTVILSDGPRSTRHRLLLASGTRLVVGGRIPGAPGPWTVRRLEDPDGRSASEARVGKIAAVWAVPTGDRAVPFSLVIGRITRAGRLPLAPDTPLEVGAPVRLPEGPATIVGLRARQRTWRKEGDRFAAEEVQRIYARRTSIPPAGRSDWRSERGTPSSRASATSRSARVRSSPGTRTARTSPRARTDATGAAVHRNAPS